LDPGIHVINITYLIEILFTALVKKYNLKEETLECCISLDGRPIQRRGKHEGQTVIGFKINGSQSLFSNLCRNRQSVLFTTQHPKTSRMGPQDCCKTKWFLAMQIGMPSSQSLDVVNAFTIAMVFNGV